MKIENWSGLIYFLLVIGALGCIIGGIYKLKQYRGKLIGIGLLFASILLFYISGLITDEVVREKKINDQLQRSFLESVPLR